MDRKELTAIEAAVLVFERQIWRRAGAKEQAIRDTFAMSATRYCQVLNALIDDPAALAADPLVVKRLRGLRDARRAARSPIRAHEGRGGTEQSVGWRL